MLMPGWCDELVPVDKTYVPPDEMIAMLLQKLLHVGVSIEALFKRVWERIEPFIFSKGEAARRASGRFESLKRQEMEAERLDRLRHPGDYQGR